MLIFLTRHTMRGVDSEVDGDGGDPLVVSRQSVCLRLNLPTNLLKISVLLALLVEKLRPLCNKGYA